MAKANDKLVASFDQDETGDIFVTLTTPQGQALGKPARVGHVEGTRDMHFKVDVPIQYKIGAVNG